MPVHLKAFTSIVAKAFSMQKHPLCLSTPHGTMDTQEASCGLQCNPRRAFMIPKSAVLATTNRTTSAPCNQNSW